MFESSTISLNKCNTPFKETQLPSVWKEHHLFEGTVLLTKNHQKELESAASFESYTMIWKYVTTLSITPFLYKYVTLLSKNSSCALQGQERLLVEGTVSFTKNITSHPQRLHTWKGKLHIPNEYCASLAYKICWRGWWRSSRSLFGPAPSSTTADFVGLQGWLLYSCAHPSESAHFQAILNPLYHTSFLNGSFQPLLIAMEHFVQEHCFLHSLFFICPIPLVVCLLVAFKDCFAGLHDIATFPISFKQSIDQLCFPLPGFCLLFGLFLDHVLRSSSETRCSRSHRNVPAGSKAKEFFTKMVEPSASVCNFPICRSLCIVDS